MLWLIINLKIPFFKIKKLLKNQVFIYDVKRI